VRALTSSGDPLLLKDFIRKTGLKAKIYVSPEPFAKNGVEAVPVTIIETKDGIKVRFEGLTENFIGEAPSSNEIVLPTGKLPPQTVQGGKQQCETR